MRIALVCPYDLSYPGGVQSHVLQFAGYADRHGHSVTIIGPMTGTSTVASIVSAGKPLPFPQPGGTTARLCFSFWNVPMVRMVLRRERYDVIHVHEPGTPILGPIVLACAPGTSAVVATFHSNTGFNFLLRIYSFLLGRAGITGKLASKLSARIAVSEAAMRLASRYLPPGSYSIIPNGVDTTLFSPKAHPIRAYADGMVNILFVGRMGVNEKRKGLVHLIAAFGRLRNQDPNVRLIIAGPGKPGRKIMSLIEQTGGIVLAGRVSAQELPGYYAAADIFCSPATHGESFGMVLAEAMASGKPVVASDMDGYRQVVLGKSEQAKPLLQGVAKAMAGLLVEPKNEAALAGALGMLAKDAAMRKRMGASGRRQAVQRFSWESVGKRILEVYEKALDRK